MSSVRPNVLQVLCWVAMFANDGMMMLAFEMTVPTTVGAGLAGYAAGLGVTAVLSFAVALFFRCELVRSR